MKKGIIVLLIAVLAAGFVFADFSGTASFSAGYDLDEKEFSLDNSKAGKGTFKFDFEAQSGATEAAESGIYADFSGSFTANVTESGVKTKLDLKDALIKSVDGLWSINLTKVANGVELTYDGNALDVYYTNKLTWGASVTTKAFEVAEGLTVSANAGYAVAKTDLTDAANYTYGFKSDVQKAINEAHAEYFKQHDNGVYYNGTLAGLQAKIKTAQDNLDAAEKAFAEEQTVANYNAVANAKKALSRAESNLKKKIAALEDDFMKAHSTGDNAWYVGSTSYTTSEYWDLRDSTTDIETYEVVRDSIILPVNADKAVTYAIYYSGTALTATDVTAYTPAANDSIVAQFDVSKGETKVACLIASNEPTTTYSDNKALYALTCDPGTQIVNGGITVAYEADKIAASVAFNAQYEFLTYKAFGFDATAKAKYDFVEGTVKFERTLKEENLLDAEVSATLDELIGMPLSVKVGSTDILNKGDDGCVLYGELGLEVVGITLKGGATMKFGNDFHETGVGRTSINGEIGYAFDFLTIEAKATAYNEYSFNAAGDYAVAAIAIDPELTLSNTSLIKNAKLSLAWAGAHFGGRASDKALGAVTATVGIKF